jgi:hypothetical protein
VIAREIRLGRNRVLSTGLTAATVAVGVILAIRGLRGSPPVLILGAVLIVAGILAYSRALRPWFLDDLGLSLAGNRRLLWSDVDRIDVHSVTPRGAGKGMPRVDLVIRTPRSTAKLLLMSRKDAAQVAALLQERLPAQAVGRANLGRVDDAWKHVT